MSNLIHMQRACFIKKRLKQIDEEVAVLYAEDYMVDADRLLDERNEVMQMLEDLKREQIA